VKTPSNASKYRSGTRADFARQAEKLEAATTTMLQRHRAADTPPTGLDPSTKATRRIERLERDATQTRDWLARNPDDRCGAKGSVRKSNRTNNESAKMATGRGVIQGYTGDLRRRDERFATRERYPRAAGTTPYTRPTPIEIPSVNRRPASSPHMFFLGLP